MTPSDCDRRSVDEIFHFYVDRQMLVILKTLPNDLLLKTVPSKTPWAFLKECCRWIGTYQQKLRFRLMLREHMLLTMSIHVKKEYKKEQIERWLRHAQRFLHMLQAVEPHSQEEMIAKNLDLALELLYSKLNGEIAIGD